jgi:hypothetical protein
MKNDEIMFVRWLERLTTRWPHEARSMLGQASASPESATAKQSDASWAKVIYPGMEGDWREFDRAALSLRCLWEMRETGSLQGLGADSAPKWSEMLLKITKDPSAWDALCYATFFNDLGKLDSTANALAEAGLCVPADHDEALLQAIKGGLAKVCPGLARIDVHGRDLWIQGLESAFNPGMAVQMEIPRQGWSSWLSLSAEAKVFHALHCYFDALGATGASEPSRPSKTLGSLDFSHRFLAACFSPDPAHFESIMGGQLGLSQARRPELAVAMAARCASPEQASSCLLALGSLPAKEREALDRLWDEKSRVAFQYAPALLSSDTSLHGLIDGMSALARAVISFEAVAKELFQGEYGHEVAVANLGAMARLRRLGDARWRDAGRWMRMDKGWIWAR